MAATSLPTLATTQAPFHVGGRTAALSGMPTKDVVFSPGAPPIKVNSNGEFAVEQMYVQFVKPRSNRKGRSRSCCGTAGGLTGVGLGEEPNGGLGSH